MKRKIIVLGIIFFSVTMLGCETNTSAQESYCGDGVCSRVESDKNLCSTDCDMV